MRFSVWPSPTRSWAEIRDLVRHCEATGWDGAWIADHFMPGTRADTEPLDGPTMECWSVLAALAASVPRIRLGPLVTSVTYRHPAVLANIAAAVDNISAGRMVLGVGAGWQENEHRAYGIELGSVRERLDRLEEACQVLLGLLREPRATFAGTHFRVTDAPNEPKPVQDPLPLLIGGGGERRTLRLAARYADEWNVWASPSVLAHKAGVLRRHCEDIGRDPAQVSVSSQALLYLSDDEHWLASKRGENPRPTIVGTPAEVVDVVAAYREAGADELIIPDWNLGSMHRRVEVLDRFVEEVAVHFRTA